MFDVRRECVTAAGSLSQLQNEKLENSLKSRHRYIVLRSICNLANENIWNCVADISLTIGIIIQKSNTSLDMWMRPFTNDQLFPLYCIIHSLGITYHGRTRKQLLQIAASAICPRHYETAIELLGFGKQNLPDGHIFRISCSKNCVEETPPAIGERGTHLL